MPPVKVPSPHMARVQAVTFDLAGTLLFVEVRSRANARHGGALASISVHKQRRIVWAARFYLQRLRHWPPCRFDVVVVESDQLDWIQAAFSA